MTEWNKQWVQLDTRQLIPEKVFTLADTTTALVGRLNAVLAAVTDVVATIEKVTGGVGNPQILAVKTAADAANKALQAIVGPLYGGAHILVVPPAPPTRKLKPLPSKIGPYEVQVLDYTALQGSGGNYGFYRTVAASLSDAKDWARPIYSDRDYIAGFVMLMGADSFVGLADAMKATDALFGAHAKGMDGNVFPAPRNVTAKPVSFPRSIMVSWDPAEIKVTEGLGISGLNIANVIVYRDTKQIPYNAPLDVLEPLQLVKKPYSPYTTTYFDTSIPAGDTQQYYYAVGFETMLTDEAGVQRIVVQPTLSASVRAQHPSSEPDLVASAAVSTFGAGTPPDWASVTAAIDIFPQLQKTIANISKLINDLVQTSIPPKSITSTTAILQQAIEKKVALIKTLKQVIQDVRAALVPIAGMYILPFYDVGGTNKFLSILNNGLFNPSVIGRPPFDTGKEITCGIVVLAGGSGAQIAAAKALAGLAATTAVSITQPATETANKIVIGTDGKPVGTGDGPPAPPPPNICPAGSS